MKVQGSTLVTGALIGNRYRLEHPLGEGGMGMVWAAEHTVTHRMVALKFLGASVKHKPELRERILREASAASALRHPHVVEVLDVFDYEPDSPVLVMELLEGETLGSKLTRDERMSTEETAALLLPVVSAVGAAHALGIVHRDLKPENIFLTKVGDGISVKVLDFGIAKLTAERYVGPSSEESLTDTGALLGTPCYMAPEQATGEGSIDHRADIWSLGVILYECLSGARPVEGDNLAQVVTRLVTSAIIPLERLTPELPHDVTAIVMQMLSRDATRRPGLDAVALMLSRYTRAKVPPFGLPKRADPEPQARGSTRPRARLAHTVSADPQGATLLSSPAMSSSVAHSGTPASQREPWRNPALLTVVALLLVTAGAVWLRSARQLAPATGTPTSTALVDSKQSAAQSPVPSQTALEPAPSSAPPATSVASATTGQRKLPRRVPRSAAPTRSTATEHAAPAPALDESTLFSGRK